MYLMKFWIFMDSDFQPYKTISFKERANRNLALALKDPPKRGLLDTEGFELIKWIRRFREDIDPLF